MRIRSVARLALPVVALLALLGTACTPVKPQVVPGRSIAYYYVQDGTTFDEFRSSTPFTRPVNGGGGAASQTLNSNGTANLNISNAEACPCGAFTGFYTHLFRLGDLVNARVVLAPGSSPAALSLVIDVSGNGEWGEWDANGMSTGLSTDETAFGPTTAGGQVEINDSRVFFLDSGNDWTLGELKAGAEPGIDANTKVGLFVFAFNEFSLFLPPSGGDANSVVTSLVLNDVQILP